MAKQQQQQQKPSSSSDRQKWQNIFKTLVSMLESQQSQLETLADDRKFLEDYIILQNNRWSSRSRLLQSQITQMKKEEVKARKVQAAKLDLLVGMKQREALCYKRHFEFAETDLEDFRAGLEILSTELCELKEKQRTGEGSRGRSGVGESNPVGNSNNEKQHIASLEREIRKLKHSYKKLSSQKETEVSALLAEKDFVWNQLRKMESDHTAILKNKNIELAQAKEAFAKIQLKLKELQETGSEKDVIISKLRERLELSSQEAEQGNKKVEQLQRDVEELRSLDREKDEMIAKLRSDLAKCEMDAYKSTVGRTRFSKDSGSQKNSGKVSRKRISESAQDDANLKRHRCIQDGSRGLQASAPVHGLERCSTIKRSTRTHSPVVRPALFHANFKLPKLKCSPSLVPQ